MTPIIYGSAFTASLVCAAIYIFIWHKHFDVNFTLIFTIVPVACLGYVLSGNATTLEKAVIASKLIYIGGCFLQLFILLCIFSLCRIEISRWIRTLLYLISVTVYLSVLSIGYLDIYYRDISFEPAGSSGVLVRNYGFMHTVFYGMICLYFAVGIAAIIYSLFRQKQVPRTIIYLLVLPDVICIVCYFWGRNLISHMELVPMGYVLAEIVFLLIAFRVNLYNISDTVIDSMVRERSIGYISFDFRYRYLGSNEIAEQLVPELRSASVDEIFGYKPSQRRIRHFLDSFRRNEAENTFVYPFHDPGGDAARDRIYNVNVNYLYDGNHRRGYLVTFTDDTANKKYIELLDSYNEDLHQEVEEKTRHIVEMHDNLILSLAMMVESRDNSTGGHIKRTSEGVRILIDEVLKEGKLSLSPEFCEDVVKAAPMHDLGKIAVDDAVLRKPGRFTEEEYAKMKQHAAEGARVIHEILLHTEDESFKIVAENVAHYHHERWDGSGYPEGLSGDRIPIEARIMAIADVYDALVSRRVYKEAYDFSRANSIISEGMGSQFDPGLRTVYENARPRLEEYYSSIG